MPDELHEVKVRFTEQQIILLSQVLEEGTYGKTLEELATNLFRQYASQALGREAR